MVLRDAEHNGSGRHKETSTMRAPPEELNILLAKAKCYGKLAFRNT